VWGSKGRLKFEVEVRDNRVGELMVWVLVREDGGVVKNVSLGKVVDTLGLYRGEVEVSGEVKYRVFAVDRAGNVNMTEERITAVRNISTGIIVTSAILLALMVVAVYVFHRRKGKREGIEE